MPWWSWSKESKPEQDLKQTPSSNSSAFNPDKLPDRHQLPKDLQTIVDKADADGRFFDDLRQG